MPSLPLNNTVVRSQTSCPTSGFPPSRSNALGSGNALRSAIICLFKIMLKNTVRRYLTFDIKSIDVIKDMIYGTLAS